MRGKVGVHGLLVGLAAGYLAAQAPAAATRPADPAVQGFLNLLDTPVISASRHQEKLSEAPATVIVLTYDELVARGYTEVSQILDDLPGMDIVRPFGDTHLKNYWRGFRNEIGEPFLVLVDGVVFNHLYFNTADTPLVAYPISAIERIEVVYGPASSVYGANAFMGVINLITTAAQVQDGTYTRSLLSVGGGAAGSRSTRIADTSFLYRKGDFSLRFSGRIENGFMDTNTNNGYEWTKNHYYGDPRLWGNIPGNPSLGGAFDSGVRNRAIDLRASLGDTELGFQYLLLDTGYGTVYPADLVQNRAVWARPELSLFLRHTRKIDDRITSTTQMRYRESDVRNDSFFVDAYESGTTSSDYVVEFSWWQSLNRSVAVHQDFDVKLGESFSLVTGLRLEQKNLQKSYDSPYGQLSHVASPLPLGNDSPFYPAQPIASPRAGNRITTQEVGVYGQAKWRFAPGHALNLGARRDRNSDYGASTTLRLGYVFQSGSWGAKALFGEAFQEPTPRLLYGGWTGSGSSLTLKPERSTTFEVSGSYTTRRLNVQLSGWTVRNEDTITGKRNLEDRSVAGFDLAVQYQLPQEALRQVKLWGYYSHLLRMKEDVVDAGGVENGDRLIGDLAPRKLMFGATMIVNDAFNTTLTGRYISRRETVPTNPVRSVPGFATLDWNANLLYRGLTFFVRANNLLDKHYFHPGIRGANSGDTPGSFRGPGGTWVGSGFSYYNSLHAQPGRHFTVGMRMDF